MRRHFAYEFDICGLDVEGTYIAEFGTLDIVALADGSEVGINLDGSPVDGGQGIEALTMARLVTQRILANHQHQDEMDRTRRYESWASHAPTVL
jgi:hypothetical protein